MIVVILPDTALAVNLEWLLARALMDFRIFFFI